MEIKDLKFENLLKEKTVIILGAGASSDYNFPLWVDLRKDIITQISRIDEKDNIYNKYDLDEYLEKNKVILKEWLDIFKNSDFDKKTVDELLYETEDLLGDVAKKYPILQLISLIIGEYEVLSLSINTKKWIEIFSDKFVDYLKSKRSTADVSNDIKFVKQCVENINIVSFNYDRAFEYFFYKNFVNKFKEGLNKKNMIYEQFYDNGSVLKVIRFFHPHGAIGLGVDSGLSGGNKIVIGGSQALTFNSKGLSSHYADYGDISRIARHIKDNETHISEVDVLNSDADSNPAYNRCNDILSEAVNIIVIGLSPKGIIQSKLRFNESAKYYFSNNKEDEKEISDKIKSKNKYFIGEFCEKLVKYF